MIGDVENGVFTRYFLNDICFGIFFYHKLNPKQ